MDSSSVTPSSYTSERLDRTELIVLSNLCDKIDSMGKNENNINVLNAKICRTFSLNELLSSRSNKPSGNNSVKAHSFLKKNALMNKLGHDKIVKKSLLAALFYVSKRMSKAIPCIFQAWKEYTFERRASKIHELLSSAHLSNEISGFASPLGMTVNNVN